MKPSGHTAIIACTLSYALLSLTAASCSSDSSDPDAMATIDAVAAADASTLDADNASGSDANLVDGNTPTTSDAGTGEDATSTDATAADAGNLGGCHDLRFGAPEVTMRMVTALPSMTGGAIPLGAYDAVDLQTTGNLTAVYRASWNVEAGGQLQIYEQIAIGGGTPPTPTPRTLTWSTSGTTLTRQQICGGTTSFSNGYSVRTEVGGTFLDVRSRGVVFTFKKRP